MKVAIISGGMLPIPAIRGGAVETGIQQIIDENEKYKQMELTVYSVYDEDAAKIAKKYNNTEIVFIKNSKAYNLIIRVVNKLFKVLNVKTELEPQKIYISKINKDIKEKNFEKVLIKNKVKFVKYLTNVKVGEKYLQIHNDFLNVDTPQCSKIYKGCNKIIVNSNYIKKQVLTIPEAKEEEVLINKNCTDVDIFNKKLYENESENIRYKYGINKEDTVIMYSGRIVAQKGVRELILACKDIKNYKYKLLIVGSSWFGQTTSNKYLEELKELSEEIKDKIIFTGYIEYKELPKLHSIVDIAVTPSMWEEPAGRVVLEAQASGISVIVSDAGGIPEYVSSESAVIVKRDEKFIESLGKNIEKLIDNKQIRETMGERGRNYAENFSARHYYEELIGLLKIK